MSKKCAYCDAAYNGRSNSKFCSLSCAAKHRGRLLLNARITVSTKVCGVCKAEKALASFSLKDAAKALYSSECKACHRQYRKAHYKKNRQREIARAASRSSEIKLWYKSIKSSLSCARCGERHPATLQFHHRNRSEKDFSISAAICRGLSVQTIEVEMAKCEILCANCHLKLHYEDTYNLLA